MIPPVNFDAISAIDWAKLAAYIDGEGCIQIERTCSATGRVYHRLSITVSNTDPRLGIWCRERFGGFIGRKHVGKSGHRRPAFNWYVMCLTAEKVLRGCMAHFVIKREEAEIALAYRATVSKNLGGDRLAAGEIITTEILQERDSLRVQLQEAKRAGGISFPAFELGNGKSTQSVQ